MGFPRPQILRLSALLFCLCAWSLSGTSSVLSQSPGPVRLVTIDGAISPALADYVVSEIDSAASNGAQALVLQLNTPGGLVTSMRTIVTAILAAPVPVIGYIAPEGAHAASAGTYIFYACHIAAMAPGTNLGAATPIEMGGTPAPKPTPESPSMPGKDGAKKPAAPEGAADLKAVNDMVALIRSLAETRGRNVDWAERAVREAATLSARQAVEQNVADLQAPSLDALLAAIDGRTVTVKGAPVVLHTKGARIDPAEPSWVTKILIVISDPNIAFILMTIGMYGLIFELSSPGAILPGLLGGISLILGLYALSVLPVNAAAAGLVLLGIIFMIAEAMAPGFGILGVGGAICFGLGALFLVGSDVPGLRISWEVALGMAGLSAAVLVGLVGYALTTHRRKVTTGREDMVGATATVIEWAGTTGFVFAKGERWRARSSEILTPGDRVVVKDIDGLELVVERSVTTATRS